MRKKEMLSGKSNGNIYNISSGEIAGYAEFFEENDLEELIVEEKGTKIVFRKAGVTSSAMPQPVMTAAAPMQAVAPGAAGAAPAAGESAPAEGASEDDGANYAKVTSPLNGTYYGAPSPEDPPYVTVGQAVSKGQTVCIVEAMKVFNEIKAESSGTIVKILHESGDIVQEGDDLIWIE